MSKITVLDENTINQIAAGEVIERPAAVVKELVENAIDAGANAVTVEIKEGGISFIRITDNGSGIEEEDMSLVFLRHSTSKIRTAEDLLRVTSLGFRGEALSSIAAISQVELVTKTSEAFTGIRYLIAGGDEKSLEHIGCPNGTTFIIRNLFYNTPARKKFLKSATTEAGYISDLMERLAVSHPNVSFKFINNGQIKLHTSGNNNLKDIIYHVYGRDITASLVSVEGAAEQVSVEGFIAKPIVSRGNRNYENYFINGRYIKSNIVNKAIEEAYRPYIMLHRYPFTALHFKINSELIDVNVHPAKLEIRFKNGEELYQFIYHSLKNALEGRELIHAVSLTEEKEEIKAPQKVPEPFEEKRRQELYPQTGNNFNANRQAAFSKGNESRTSSYLSDGYNPVNPDAMRTSYQSGENKERMRETEIGKLDEVLHSPSAHYENLKGNEKTVNNEKGNETENGHLVKESGSYNLRPVIGAENALNQSGSYNKGGADENRGINGLSPVGSEEGSQLKENQHSKNHSSGINGDQINEIQTAESVGFPTGTDSLPANEVNALPGSESSYVNNSDIIVSNPEQMSFISEEAVKSHRIIGQVFSTYWIIEFGDKMFMIDQHAAHEKVLYEKTMLALKEKQFNSQLIEPPIILTLSLREEEALKKHLDTLYKIGFEIEEFGGKEYAVRSVPSDLFGLAQKEILIELIDGLVDEVYNETPEMILEKVASLSCKAAVKGNHKLSFEEAKALIDQLLTLENPYNCPHGRPTIISMSKYEIEKKFKRIV